MMAYIDFGLGFLASWAILWIFTTRIWHNWAHQHRNTGLFLRGRLVCWHCTEEMSHITKDQWRDEALDKLRRLL